MESGLFLSGTIPPSMSIPPFCGKRGDNRSAEWGQCGCDCGTELINLGQEVLPGLGNHGSPFYGPVTTLRQALEHIHKFQHLV